MVDSNSLDRFARPNRVEVDCAAIAHNVRSIRRFVGADTRIYAALKGNGYGFGLMRAAREAAAAGADGMSVADLADGIACVKAGWACRSSYMAAPCLPPRWWRPQPITT